MGQKFKVVLSFLYDSEESVEDWNVDVPFTHVTTTQEAIDCAISEINENGTDSLEFEVYDEEGELI